MNNYFKFAICLFSTSLGAFVLYYLRLTFKKKAIGIRNNVFELMKNTPMIYIKSLSELTGCNIYAKSEHYLPFSSKDRMIKNIILEAKRTGKLHSNSVIYEGSSGSTAYSVASIARLFGYKCTIVIPDDVSTEKKKLLQLTNCQIIETKQCPFSNFKDNYVRLAKKLSLEDPNGFYVDQFFNKNNYETHLNETGPEIWNDLGGKIDAFVSSAGTGGTIGGISQFLKNKNKDIKVFLADVAGSGLESYVKNKVMFTKEESEALRKKYRYYSIIEGVGVNFLTDNFIKAEIDDAYKISDDEAIFMADYINEKDGLLIGGSTAVNLCGVVKACRTLGKGKNVVTMIFDSGLKYISASKLFNTEKNGCSVKSIYDI